MALFFVFACGKPPAEDAATPAVRIALPSGGELVLAEWPERLLPTNAGTTDLLLALAGPERFAALPIAADTYSRVADESERWAEVPRFTGFAAETLLSKNPDLVVAHAWQSAETLDLIRGTGVSVLVLSLPQTWEDIEISLAICGRALGLEARATDVALELGRRREALAKRARSGGSARALSYVNLGAGGWAAGSGTTADILFGLAGFENGAAAAGLSGHTTIDIERIFAIDPDFIVVGAEPDREGDAGMPPTEAWLRRRPELVVLKALAEDGILTLDPRLFTTSSIELMTGAERLRDAFEVWRAQR